MIAAEEEVERAWRADCLTFPALITGEGRDKVAMLISLSPPIIHTQLLLHLTQPFSWVPQI